MPRCGIAASETFAGAPCLLHSNNHLIPVRQSRPGATGRAPYSVRLMLQWRARRR